MMIRMEEDVYQKHSLTKEMAGMNREKKHAPWGLRLLSLKLWSHAALCWK